jgi:hypothetical protein
MSYYQGTQLYYHGRPPSYATVVTDGNVMITGGLGAGTIIKLADWLILANGEEIHEACTPLPPTVLNQMAEAKSVAKPVAEPVAEPVSKPKSEVKLITSLECGCRSDGLLCDTHLYE